MFTSGTKSQKIDFLTEFYERRYQERNFKFRASDISLDIEPSILEEMIIEISRHTEFRAMKFKDNDGVYFVICKL